MEFDLDNPIDWDHPDNEGLVCAFMPVPGSYAGNRWIDLARPQRGAVPRIVGNYSERGLEIVKTTVNSSVPITLINDDDLGAVAGTMSIRVEFFLNGVPTGPHAVVFSQYDAFAAGRLVKMIRAGTSLQCQFFLNLGSAILQSWTIGANGSLKANATNQVEISIVGTTIRARVNDRLFSGTVAATGGIVATTPIYLGGELTAGSENQLNGTISRFEISRRPSRLNVLLDEAEGSHRLRRLTRIAYSFPAAPPAITRRPFFSDWGSMC